MTGIAVEILMVVITKNIMKVLVPVIVGNHDVQRPCERFPAATLPFCNFLHETQGH